jgi:hypothetical protein
MHVRMKLISAFLASACAALALAGAALADLQIGVVDDRAKGAGDITPFFAQMNDVGLTQVRVTVLWDPASPLTIPEQAEIERMLPFAQSRGVKVVLALYPLKPTHVGSSAAAAAEFAAFTAHVARTFPSVTEFIVGNEPNQTRFWQPQFDGNGGACVAFTRMLASSYDALKSVDPANKVIGVGLSPRGNDDPTAKSNVSHSPVTCLRDMGAAYRGLARAKPLMDEFSFHPYPKTDRDPLMKGYRWPNAGVPDLGRIKQAFWDAFHGTRQPLFAEGGRAGGLKFRLDEVGWQVRVLASSEHAYEGTENIQPTDEDTQARIYGELIRFLGCDPSVESLLFFGLVDEPDLDRWQAGLVRADGTLRPAYGAVKSTFAQTQGRCAGKKHSWRHTETVLGAKAKFPPTGRFLPVKHRYFAFNATAQENALFRAGIFRVGGPNRVDRKSITRSLTRGGGLRRANGLINAYWTPLIKFPGRPLPRGWYVYGVRLAAEMNPNRTATFVGRPFRVGHPGLR